MKIRIYTGLISKLLFGRKLRKMRFFPKKEQGIRYYQRHLDDSKTDELKQIQRYCRHRLLPCKVTEDRMERRPGYRNRFFREKRGLFGSRIYLCAYCGRPMREKNTSVDHIVPVKKASTSGFYKRLLLFMRIKNVNDIRNLAPSCTRCNLEKSSRGGLWVIRGFFGRSWLRILLKEALLLVIGSYLLYLLYNLLSSSICGDIAAIICEYFHS